MTTRRDTVYNGPTKTYATRNAKGEFVERVTHKRASRVDQRRTTVAEAERRVLRALPAVIKAYTIPDSDYASCTVFEFQHVYVAWMKLVAARKSARAAKRKAGGK